MTLESPGAGPALRPAGLRRVVYVDRDGTINPDLRYLKEAERLEVYRGVVEAVRLLRLHGYAVVCVTNQSGVERGFYSTEDVERIHARLNAILGAQQTAIDAFYYCPHAPETGCRCRKPGTELFERAERELGLVRHGSAIIGDRGLDIEAGEKLGLITALVPSPGHDGEAVRELLARGVHPDIVAPSMRAAAARLLAIG